MLGPIYCSCTRGSRTHKRKQRKTYVVSHHGVWDVWSLFLLFSLPGLLPSFPSFLPIPRICFPKPVCILCSPVIMDLSASDPITKLPVVCLYFVLFLFKVKKKGGALGRKPSKENQIDPAYHFESCFGTGHWMKFGLVILRLCALLHPISFFSISGTKMNSI